MLLSSNLSNCVNGGSTRPRLQYHAIITSLVAIAAVEAMDGAAANINENLCTHLTQLTAAYQLQIESIVNSI